MNWLSYFKLAALLLFASCSFLTFGQQPVLIIPPTVDAQVKGIAVSSDGKLVATLSFSSGNYNRGFIRIYQTESMLEIKRITISTDISSHNINFCQNNDCIITRTDYGFNEVRFLEPGSDKSIYIEEPGVLDIVKTKAVEADTLALTTAGSIITFSSDGVRLDKKLQPVKKASISFSGEKLAILTNDGDLQVITRSGEVIASTPLKEKSNSYSDILVKDGGEKVILLSKDGNVFARSSKDIVNEKYITTLDGEVISLDDSGRLMLRHEYNGRSFSIFDLDRQVDICKDDVFDEHITAGTISPNGKEFFLATTESSIMRYQIDAPDTARDYTPKCYKIINQNQVISHIYGSFSIDDNDILIMPTPHGILRLNLRTGSSVTLKMKGTTYGYDQNISTSKDGYAISYDDSEIVSTHLFKKNEWTVDDFEMNSSGGPYNKPLPVARPAISIDGDLIAFPRGEAINVLLLKNKKKICKIPTSTFLQKIFFSSGRNELVSVSLDGIRYFSLKTCNLTKYLEASTYGGFDSRPIGGSPNITISGSDIVGSSYANEIILVSRNGNKILKLASLPKNSSSIASIYYSQDRGLLIIGFEGNSELTERKLDESSVLLFDVLHNEEICRFNEHTDSVVKTAVSRDGKLIFSGSKDGTLRIFDAQQCTPIAQISISGDGEPIITDARGRFSVPSLENNNYAHWVLPEAPTIPLSFEILARDYFEPFLLPRIFLGDSFSDTPPIEELNLARPDVEILSVTPRKNQDENGVILVDVTVKVSGRCDNVSKNRTDCSSAYDLKLFRDHQLVGQKPDDSSSFVDLSPSGRQNWLKKNIVADRDKPPSELVFENVRVAADPDYQKALFSAYAFNESGIKSETSTLDFELKGNYAKLKRVAYIVSIGINSFQDKSWDLNWAANDARQSADALYKSLKTVKLSDGSLLYDHVVSVLLTSDASVDNLKSHGDKLTIENVIKTLSGQKLSTDLPGDIDVTGGKLQRVSPHDSFFLTISTHGFIDYEGQFYFLPSDTGSVFKIKNSDKTKENFSRAISSEELKSWMIGLDAISQILVIDACHSAASIEENDFKPGPFGAKGFGQLAYDKAMQVIVASQADQAAIEQKNIKMGLLTYALIDQGLNKGKAGSSSPYDERITLTSDWLRYASQTVPYLYKEISKGRLKGSRGTIEFNSTPETDEARRASVQQPTYFNFSRGIDFPIKTP